MKKPLIKILAGAVLFGSGIWIGSHFERVLPETEQAGLLPAFSTRESAVASTGPLAITISGRPVRAFQPGRPFESGHAKEWLLARAAELQSASEDGSMMAYADLAQVFFTMDEESVMEAVKAIQEIIALSEAKDPEVNAVLRGDDLGRRAHFAAFYRLAQLNPEAAIAMSKDIPGGHWRGEYNMAVIARLAEQNPARAEAMLTSLEGKERRRAFDVMLESMARSHPAAAFTLAEKFPSDTGDGQWKEIITRLTRQNPRQGIDAAANLAAAGRGTEPLRSAMALWLGRDAAAALAWLEQYEGTGRAAALAEVIISNASADPNAAAASFVKLQSETTDQKELADAAASIARRIVENDFTAAQSWVAGLREGAAKDKAVETVAYSWVKKDAEAASRWIATLPAGAGRDGASVALVEAIKHRDPAGAFEWARNIQNEQLRQYTAGHVLHIWHSQDPEAVKAAVQNLPSEARKNLPFAEN